MYKICSKCKNKKLFSEFNKDGGGKFGLRVACRDCDNIRKRAYYAKPEIREHNRAVCKEYSKRNKHLTADAKRNRNYGVDIVQYFGMLVVQDGKCAICRVAFGNEKTTRGHVDHDHLTGKVRGLLCVNCNHAIGKFRDDPALMHKAADYVERGGFSCEVVALPNTVQNRKV